MFKKFFLMCVALSIVTPVFASAAPLPFKNTLPKSEWATYGVNPWRLDTDNDGYPDFWEVQNNYCPTHPSPLRLDDGACEKGSFDLKKQTYTAPAAIADSEPQKLVQYASCGALKSNMLEYMTYSSLGPYHNSALTELYVPSVVGPLQTMTGYTAPALQDGSVSITITHQDAALNNRPTPSTIIELWTGKNTAHPKLIRSFEYEGVPAGATVANGYAHLAILNDAGIFNDAMAASAFVPRFRMSVGSKKINSVSLASISSCQAILRPQKTRDLSMVTLISLPLHSNEKPGVLTVVGAGPNVYIAKDSAYVFMSDYQTWWTGNKPELTEAYKFDIYKNRISYRTSQTIPGTVFDGYSMEQTTSGEPILRVATTNHFSSASPTVQNNLYFFDADFNRVGWLENVGGRGDVASIWTVDNRLYMSTYDANDPLFIFDVSNPRAPAGAGALSQ